MLKGSKHENCADPDGWCAAHRSKNLRDLILDLLKVVFEPDNSHLHEPAVIVCEEVRSFSDLAIGIVDVVQLFAQIIENGLRKIQNDMFQIREVTVLDDFTQSIEYGCLQAARNESLLI